MNNLCSPVISIKAYSCDFNYMPVTKKILLRKRKDGQMQIKINGRGKWINADYNAETKTISYLA